MHPGGQFEKFEQLTTDEPAAHGTAIKLSNSVLGTKLSSKNVGLLRHEVGINWLARL